MANNKSKMAKKLLFFAKINFLKNSLKSHILSPTYPKRTMG